MNSNYTSVVGLAIAMLLCSQPAISQVQFLDCYPEPLSRCVNDAGIALPESNQLLIGINTPGATSCGVHVIQSRTVSTTCDGPMMYYVSLIVNDSTEIILQPLTTLSLDPNNQVLLPFDTRLSESAAIRNNGLSYNTGCNDYHRIRWVAIDYCSNEVVCEEQINLYDCQTPDFTNTGNEVFTAVLPVGCLLTLFAKDYILDLQDDCLVFDDYLYSFNESSFQPSFTYHPCWIPYNVPTPVSIWVADKGRDLNCDNFIQWWERQRVEQVVNIRVLDNSSGVCPPCIDEFTVSGKVYMENLKPVKLVAVTGALSTGPLPTYITAEDGRYQFTNIEAGETLTITASRNDNHRNGVTTLDLLKIQRHLVQTELLDSPYKRIAADVNNSQSISAIDLIELRKLLLGIYSVFPNSPSWRFVDAAYDFPPPPNPGNPGSIEITVNEDVTNADFIGIKIGDVNNSAKSNFQQALPRSPRPTVSLEVNEQVYKAGEIIDIPVSQSWDEKLLGFQFNLESSDLEFIGILSGHLTIEEGEYSMSGGKLSMSWFSLDAVDLSPGEKLFTIQARAKRSGNLATSLHLSTDVIEAELYDRGETIYELALSVQSNDAGIMLLPLMPNPASDDVFVPFFLSATGPIHIQFTSIDNKVVYSNTVNGYAGRNEVAIPVGQLTNGLLICSLQSDSGIRTQKVMVIK